MRAALVERNTSANSAAAQLGISAATLSSWLNGQTEPPLRMMRPISEITGLAEDVLSEMAGYLPRTHRAASYQLQAALQLQSGLADIRRWINLWMDQTTLGPAASIAGMLLEHRTDWSVNLVPDVRGSDFPMHHATFLSVRPNPSMPAGQGLVEDEIPEAVESGLGEALRMTGTVWRDNQRHVSWGKAPRNVLTTPHLERSRGPQLTPYHGAPLTVPVVGTTYAHAETVGALLADAWGYGYQNAAFATMERTGISRRDDPDREAQAETIRRWINSPTPTLDRSVWCFADYKAVRRVLPDLVDLRVPVIVAITGGDRLLSEAGASMWNEDGAAMLEAQHALIETLTQSGTTVVMATIGDYEIVDDKGRISDHLIWDGAVRAAWQILEQLTPGLTEIGGDLSITDLGGGLGQYASVLVKEDDRPWRG